MPDRIGMFDEQGIFVDSHKILALLVRYLYEEKGLRGSVVKTFSTTDMLDRMAEVYKLDIEITPIGFKYIGPKMVETDVLVGGEESGGMAVFPCAAIWRFSRRARIRTIPRSGS